MARECPVVGLARRTYAVCRVDVVSEEAAVGRIEIHVARKQYADIGAYRYVSRAEDASAGKHEAGEAGERGRVGRVYADE